MKKMIFLSVLLIAGTAVFAQGVPEVSDDGGISLVLRSYRGTISAEGADVLLTSGTETYVLHYHMRSTAGIAVEAGDAVSVEGYLLPADFIDDDRKHLLAARAEIGGETFLLGPIAEQGRLIVSEDQLLRMISRGRHGMVFQMPHMPRDFQKAPAAPHGRFGAPVQPRTEVPQQAPRSRGWR